MTDNTRIPYVPQIHPNDLPIIDSGDSYQDDILAMFNTPNPAEPEEQQ